MTKNKLALSGGVPVRNTQLKPWPHWPVWDDRERTALLKVLDSGVWSYNGSHEQSFNKQFAAYIGTKHAISAVNGTVTLQLALEALGIGWGDEVLVPGLTWQATAASVLDVNATPILVDVSLNNWCINPVRIREAITPNTRAIIPVHLYGSFANMDEIMSIAREHNLAIIEDCAHKHGGSWRGQRAGSIGDIGSFSFQLSKHLTAGEGGTMTTNQDDLAEKLDALRNCGRRPERRHFDSLDKGAGYYEDDGNFIQSGNYRLSEFQAAILVEGLKRLPEQNEVRQKNGLYLDTKISEIPGINSIFRHDSETEKAYFNFNFHYEASNFNNLPVTQFRAALNAELGLKSDTCYEPLNQCSLYVPHTKPARHRITEDYWKKIDPRQYSLPNCNKIFRDHAICMHHSVLLGSNEDMDDIVTAIKKVYEYSEQLILAK